MEIFRIMGGKPIRGTIRIGGAKNAILPLLAASLLTEEPVCLTGCAALSDVENMIRILGMLGAGAKMEDDVITVNPAQASRWEMPEHLSKLIRSSIFMLGPILGRFRKATVTYPGGCEIGLRPIDLHLKGLRALGVRIREAHGMIYCDGSHMHSGEIMLDFPSVGATENVMMAAVLIPGKTVILNAAREPEITDLQEFINSMGGCVSGAGTGMIVIDGVKKLRGTHYRVMPDRIVAGTLLTAAAMTGGDIAVRGARACDLDAVLDKLSAAGCEIIADDEGISLKGPEKLRPVDVSTQPYPGFPTDMQAQMLSMCCVAHGTSVIIENVFESRFAHAAQLIRMGADITVSHRAAIVRGGRLTGARVCAKDLRGGAALVLAGLAAEGATEIQGVSLIDRGYESLEKMLGGLGADITRI
ncbi:MAG: UDP-N-acetylglucosamine 1-carboxyvinyltransferase [Clostridia bacterium]|nr:UDP-N-acetylglucosamine 1-carboxyvinyltransferase [Clostridia bacterium]